MLNNKSAWSNFKLRAQLLRIWFMKNILVWLQIFLIVCVVLILTGNITEHTPILGFTVYPLFKPLINEIAEIALAKEITGLMDFFAVSISILVSIGVGLVKVRNIAQTDIKSDKLKIALIQANLYFNENGKLVRKTEAMVGRDLNGDGVIEGAEPQVTTGLISGIVTATKELGMIVTTDFSGTDKEDELEYQTTLDSANLRRSEKALNDIDAIVKNGIGDAIVDAAHNEADKRAKKIKEDTNISEEEKEKKIWLFEFFKGGIFKFFKKRKKEENVDNTEVLVNNIEVDAKVNPIEAVLNKDTKAKEVKKANAEDVFDTKKIVVAQTKQPVKANDGISDFLAQFKK